MAVAYTTSTYIFNIVSVSDYAMLMNENKHTKRAESADTFCVKKHFWVFVKTVLEGKSIV